MIKKSLLLTMLLAIFAPWAANAQTTGCEAIGEQSTNYGAGGYSGAGYVPVDTYYKYSYEQMVYDGSEMPTTITSISFKYKSTYSMTEKNNVDIYLGETLTATLSSWMPASDLTLVYSGALDFPSSSDGTWVEFTFNQNGGSFSHDQSKYIVVVINDKSNGYPSNYSSMYFCYQSCESGAHKYVRRDSGGEYSVPPTNSASDVTQYPIVRFCGTFPEICCPKPKNLACTGYTANTATFTWTNGGEETQWVLEYATTSDFSDATSVTIIQSDLVNGEYTLTGLTADRTYYARIKAYCPSCTPNYSDWSNTCEFKPSNTVYAVIGTGQTASSNGIYGGIYTYNNYYAYTQQIYTATELTTAGARPGVMQEIALKYAETTASNLTFEVYLGQTTGTSLSSAWISDANLTKVYEGTNTFSGNGNWNSIDVTTITEWEWDGTSNIVVAIRRTDKSSPAVSYPDFYYTSATDMCRYTTNSSNNITLNDSYVPSEAGSTTNQRPDIQFGIVSNPTPKPRNLQVSNITPSQATISWEAPASATPTDYEFEWKKSSESWSDHWTSSQGGLAVDLTGISASTDYDVRVRAVYAEGKSDPIQTGFRTLDACAFPTNFIATTTPGFGTEADFSWVKGYDETAWVLQIATDANFTTNVDAFTTGFVVDGNNVTYHATGLTPEQTYYAHVKADCSGSTSTYSDVATFTPSNYVDYTYGANASNTTSTIPFYGSYANDNRTISQYIIPATELADVAGGTIRSLTYYTNSTPNWGAATVKVYVKEVDYTTFAASSAEAVEDWETMTQVYNGSLTVSNGQMTITFDDTYLYGGGNLMIGIKMDQTGTSASVSWSSIYNSSAYTGLYAYYSTSYYSSGMSYNRSNYYPKTTINYQPTPYKSPVIDETNCTFGTTTAHIAWTVTDATPTGYQYQYKLASASEWPASWSSVTTAYADLSNLTSSSSYDFRVKALYDGDNESIVVDYGFRTTCGVIDALGYSENFDSYTAGNNVLPNCWSYINTTTNSTYAAYPRVYANTSYSTYASSAPNCLYLNSYGSSDPQPQYAILPEMTGLAGLQVTLKAKGYNASSTLKIGTMSDPTDASTFTMIADEQTLTTSYPTEPFEFIIPADCSDSYLAIMIDAAPSGYNTRGVYVDDIVIREAPTCLKPTELEATANALTATITWVSEVGEYEVAHATNATANPDENIAGTATEETYTMNDLTLGDHYFWVRANCGTDDYSEWVGPASVHIGYCVPAPTNVDGNGISNVSFGMGDNVVNNDTPKATYADYSSQIGAVQAGVEATVAITYAHTYNYGTFIWVDLNNDLDFEDEGEILYYGMSAGSVNPHTLNATITIPATQTPGDYMMRIGGADSGFDTYASADPCYTGTWACFQDYTLRVLEAPSCLPAGNVTVANVTNASAVISWTNNNGDGATYTVMQGQTVLTTTAVDSYELTGLTAATTYAAGTFTIISGCDENVVANVPEFTTECDVVVVDAAHPFTEGFEGTTFAPTCWNTVPSSIDYWTRSTAYKHTGSASASSGYYGPIYLVMPDLQLGTDGDAIQLTFWSYNTFTSDYGKNSVVLLDGDSETELWSPESVSQAWVETTIDLTAYMGQTISLAFKYEGDDAHGWYIDDVNVFISFTKTIIAHSADGAEEMTGWYLIASPLYNSIPVSTVGHMTDNEFDLYRFNQAPTVNSEGEYLEWENYKSHTEDFLIESGIGYLYANSGNVTLTFTGTPYESEYDKVIQLSCTDDNPSEQMRGWNLVGNPYTVKAYPRREFYVMNDAGNEIVASNRPYIEPMEGAFVYAQENEELFTFYRTESQNGNKGSLGINVMEAANHRGNGLIDRAVVRFGEGNVLPKFQLNPNHTKVYIPQGNKDCAVVYSEGQGEMPISFRAKENGTYTLSFSSENTEFNYLHLIDNMTGMDVDLLQTPSYTFDGRTTDYSSRFRLVFATGNNNDSDNFAFYSNGTWVISNDGEATLQVVDVMGRVLSSETVSGSVSKAINASAGVYMLRLINGNDVKTQKIVVR